MRRDFPRALWLALLTAAACASEPAVSARWVDADGETPASGALEAARNACSAEVDKELPARSNRALDHIAWGHAMRKCMERRGFVLVAEPPDE